MIKAKFLRSIKNDVFSDRVLIGISLIIGGSITTKLIRFLIDFILVCPFISFIIYGALKVILFIVDKLLVIIYNQKINNSIPVKKIKFMVEQNYIDVPKLEELLQEEYEKIPSDKNVEYLINQERVVRELLIKAIHSINTKNIGFYKELKEDILNNITEETSIKSLYNMLTSMITNSKISILQKVGDVDSANALNKFYEVTGQMSKYNYALDLTKYENRRNGLCKYVNHGNYLIDQLMKEILIKQKGDNGEKAVESEIALYDDYLTYLSNIRVEVDGTSIETDGIIVCDKGVFALEIKNYGSERDVIRVAKDGKASYINKNNEERNLDFISQHNRHCGLKQKLINNELRKKGIVTDYVIINPIIVIGNDKVNIVNDSEIKILRASIVIHEILQIKENILSKEVQGEIIKIINDNKLPLKSYDVVNIEKPLGSLLDSLVKGINYLIEVIFLNEKVYEILNENSYIEIDHMDIINKGLFDGSRNGLYQIVVKMKD